MTPPERYGPGGAALHAERGQGNRQPATAQAKAGVKNRQSTPDEAVLSEIVRRIVCAVQPERIIMFGSAARGEMGPHSDIDLLVVKDCERPLKAMQEIYRNLWGLGVAVDALVATPSRVERYRDSHALVFKPALREGRVIYEAA